jgi:hypothetical protein
MLKYQSPFSVKSFCFSVDRKNVPVATEYTLQEYPASSKNNVPLQNLAFAQFLRSSHSTCNSTVVRKIGEIPFVPAIIGAILINGT